MARGAPKVKMQYHKGDNRKGADRSVDTSGSSGTVPPISRKSRQSKPNTGVAFVPSDDHRMIVRLGAAIGYTEDQLARLINFPFGIAPKTLRKHFRAELDHGGDFVNIAVVKNLFRIAIGNEKSSASAAIFWAKSRLKWRTGDNDLSLHAKGEGKDGKGDPVPVEFTLKIGDRDDAPED